VALVGALALLVLAVLARARRASSLATRAYRALRVAVSRRDPAVGPATAPLALRAWVAEHVPSAQASAGDLIDRYLYESYGGGRLSRRDALAVRRDLRRARRLLRGQSALPS
jgi:hypothetical protein